MLQERYNNINSDKINNIILNFKKLVTKKLYNTWNVLLYHE